MLIIQKDKSVLDTYPGIVYILDNNNFDTSKGTCKSLGTCTDSQLNEYLTQIAIWWYIDKVMVVTIVKTIQVKE